MDEFYIQRNGWNIAMFHGGKLAPGRVLIYVYGTRGGKFEWSLRDPIRRSVLRSGTFGHIAPGVIEAAVLGPIWIPRDIRGLSVESEEWEVLARSNTPDPVSNFSPGIAKEEQWIDYVPQRDLAKEELP